MRVPRMTGFPSMTFGLISIRSVIVIRHPCPPLYTGNAGLQSRGRPSCPAGAGLPPAGGQPAAAPSRGTLCDVLADRVSHHDRDGAPLFERDFPQRLMLRRLDRGEEGGPPLTPYAPSPTPRRS